MMLVREREPFAARRQVRTRHENSAGPKVICPVSKARNDES